MHLWQRAPMPIKGEKKKKEKVTSTVNEGKKRNGDKKAQSGGTHKSAQEKRGADDKRRQKGRAIWEDRDCSAQKWKKKNTHERCTHKHIIAKDTKPADRAICLVSSDRTHALSSVQQKKKKEEEQTKKMVEKWWVLATRTRPKRAKK
nr:hypothetical protein [Pandoravirus aubagnensis]